MLDSGGGVWVFGLGFKTFGELHGVRGEGETDASSYPCKRIRSLKPEMPNFDRCLVLTALSIPREDRRAPEVLGGSRLWGSGRRSSDTAA